MTLMRSAMILVAVILSMSVVAHAGDKAAPDAALAVNSLTAGEAAAVISPIPVRVVSDGARQPVDVRVTSTPEDPTAKSLAQGTWGLVLITTALCVATLWIGRKQAQDARSSLAISRDAADAARRSADAAANATEAAARAKAAEQLRELNLSAHRVAIKATQVQKLSLSVPREMRELGTLMGMGGANARVDLAETAANERHVRASAIATEAMTRIPDASVPPSDKEADDRLRQLDAWLIQLEAIGGEVEDELRGIREQISFARQRDTQFRAAVISANRPP